MSLQMGDNNDDEANYDQISNS